MLFTKYPHRANFTFADGYDAATGEATFGSRRVAATVEAYEGDVYHLRLRNESIWAPNGCLESLTLPPKARDDGRLTLDRSLNLVLDGEETEPLLQATVGLCGEKSLFEVVLDSGARYYGMGEKTFGRVELSGLRTRFWNTDVWGDFHPAQWSEHPTDPPYVSIPYVVVRQGGTYLGLLLHNPWPAFMETPGTDESRAFVEWQNTHKHLLMGNEGGEPNLWIILGPTLPELTRKLQRLVGVTPLPPAWALGYHQSRWGYGGHTDLLALDEAFAKHQIPCDALWLDLDYMDGYRIFTVSDTMFPEGLPHTLQALKSHGRRMVPILDPGVKREPGNPVFDDGVAKGVFCQNPEGEPFVGLVWPGETVFPDFTTGKGREWWAGYAEAFFDRGFAASWLDMNDPSTGPVDPDAMLFRDGTESHDAHRNQYALGMQIATAEGFRRAKPDERPFLLSRSGFIGSSKHAAIWTGDNLSNSFYLQNAIPTSLGLSLSGQPFNGPDMGGFGGHATEALMVDWIKAGFLFPFLRNHSDRGSSPQEPFAYPTRTMEIVRRYIRLRYKLFPYLYNLFIDAEELGDPVMRPLFYHFDAGALDLINDQFMVGPSVMQAPFVREGKRTRPVVLPGDAPWYDAANGAWLAPGETVAKAARESTPLYVRAGAVLPMQPGTPTTNAKDLAKVHLHLFVPDDWNGEIDYRYRADDGLSYAYRNGGRSALRVHAVCVDGHLAITTDAEATGFGTIEAMFVIHGAPKSVRLNSAAVELRPSRVTLTGRSLPVQVVG